MQTKPQRAYIQSFRFLRCKYGNVAADVFDLLFKKRDWLFDEKKILNTDSWFYYRSSDLLHDFDGNRTKSMRKLDPAINELVKAGLISKTNSIHPELGSVREYRINDKVFKDHQDQFGDCWLRKKHVSTDQKETDYLVREVNEDDSITGDLITVDESVTKKMIELP